MKTEGTIVLPCTCKHDIQDQMYGNGRRLHNIATNKNGVKAAFCTVCTPRNLSCDKLPGDLPPNPMLGFMGTPPKRNRTPKII